MAAVLVGCCLYSCKGKGGGKGEEKIADSLAYFTKQIKEHPNDAEWYYKRAKFQFEHDFVEEAHDDIIKAVKIKNTQSSYYLLLADIDFARNISNREKRDNVEEHLQKAIQLDPSNNEARIRLAEFLYFYAKGDPTLYDEALQLIAEAREKDPYSPNADAFLIEAMCYKEKGDTSRYLQHIQKVIDIDENSVKAYREMGQFYKKHNNPLGIDYYQNALRVDPTNAEINYNLGEFYIQLGLIEEANELFQHMVTVVKPNQSTQYIQLVHWKAPRDKNDPTSVEYIAAAYYHLGYYSLYEKQDDQEAIELFTKAINSRTKDNNILVNSYYARGECYENLGQYDQARIDYNRALQIVDNFEPAIQGLNSIDQKQKALE